MGKPSPDFKELCELRERVHELAVPHVSALAAFHLEPSEVLEEVAGFSHMLLAPGETRQVSIASTATCLRSIALSSLSGGSANIDLLPLLERLSARHKQRQFNTAGLRNKNAFTVGLFLSCLHVAGADANPSEVTFLPDLLERATRSLSVEGVGISPYDAHAYLTYWVMRGLTAWDPTACKSRRFKGCIKWTEREFYRQLALFASSPDDEDSDAFQLGYALLILFRFRRTELKDEVIRQALRILFDAQLPRGVWEKRAPLFVYGKKGDAYCFSFELLTALFEEFSDEQDFLSPLSEHFSRALNWAERNSLRLGDGSESIRVWRSGHRVDDKGPESWATAEVYLFFQLYRRFLSGQLQKLILRQFKGSYFRSSNTRAMQRLYQPSVFLPKEDEDDTGAFLADLLTARVLDPLRTPAGAAQFSLAYHPKRKRCVRSGIFFGPPGTGKTTYVKAVAKYLGWPLVVLDPSDFAKEGLHLIPNTTSKIFQKLLELEDTVIFFDEMEELLRERKSHGETPFEQKFLTTSLLPKLQDLHDRASCLFFVATNYYNTIDRAAKREGRFDFRVQILPPCLIEKKRMLNEVFGGEMPSEVEGEIDRHKEKVAWATLNEMFYLKEKIAQSPSEVRDVIEGFRPALRSESSGDEWEDESRHNFFATLV